MKTNRSRIAIVYFDAASGHRSAAAALQKILQSRNPGCQVQMINITDIFDHHPVFGKVVRASINYFNRQLKKRPRVQPAPAYKPVDVLPRPRWSQRHTEDCRLLECIPTGYRYFRYAHV